jgi:phage shock protein E
MDRMPVFNIRLICEGGNTMYRVRKTLLGIVLVVVMIVLAGCTSGVQSISPRRAKQMLENDPDVVLIDVRTYEEFLEQRIPGAKLLPLAEINERHLEMMPDKEATYIIYCRSGNRSVEAILLLKELGYQHLYDLGGIIDWPYETI